VSLSSGRYAPVLLGSRGLLVRGSRSTSSPRPFSSISKRCRRSPRAPSRSRPSRPIEISRPERPVLAERPSACGPAERLNTTK